MAAGRYNTGSSTERQAAYSRAARIGGLVAVSATAATDEDGKLLHPGDVTAQTRVALEKVIAAAERLGARRADTLRTRIYLAEGSDWRGPVEAHRQVFGGIDPASGVLFVSGFPLAGALVEVELDAAVLDGT